MRILKLSSIILFMVLLSFGASAQTQIPLIWTDTNGNGYGPTSLRGAKASVFVFDTPMRSGFSARLKQLEKLEAIYFSKRIRLYLIDAMPLGKTVHFTSTIPVVKDEQHYLRDRMGVNSHSSFIVLGRDCNELFRGNCDPVVKSQNSKILESVLKSLDSGSPLPHPQKELRGNDLIIPDEGMRGQSNKFTYYRDIKTILDKNCVSCHQKGEVAPFSLATYKEAKTWAAMIRDVTKRHIMPPWKAKAGFGDFHDARVLTSKEIETLSAWSTDFAPAGKAPSRM